MKLYVLVGVAGAGKSTIESEERGLKWEER